MDKLLKLLSENARLSGEQMAVMLNSTEAEVNAAIAKLERMASSAATSPSSTGKRPAKRW